MILTGLPVGLPYRVGPLVCAAQVPARRYPIALPVVAQPVQVVDRKHGVRKGDQERHHPGPKIAGPVEHAIGYGVALIVRYKVLIDLR